MYKCKKPWFLSLTPLASPLPVMHCLSTVTANQNNAVATACHITLLLFHVALRKAAFARFCLNGLPQQGNIIYKDTLQVCNTEAKGLNASVLPRVKYTGEKNNGPQSGDDFLVALLARVEGKHAHGHVGTIFLQH